MQSGRDREKRRLSFMRGETAQSGSQPLIPSPGMPGEGQDEGFGEPAWDIAKLFPVQGDWAEQEYLELEHRGNRHVEFIDGRIEVPRLPGILHQMVVGEMLTALDPWTKTYGFGSVL